MIYLVVNQDGYFLGKSGEWLDGRELTPLYRSSHKDEALNQLFEVNSRDYSLRLQLLECEANNKNLPVIPVDILPPPLPKEVQETEEEQLPLEAIAS